MKMPRVLAIVAVLFAAATPAQSQIPGAAFCDPVTVYNDTLPPESMDAVQRMHPLLSRARYADAVNDEQWSAVVRALRVDATEAFAVAAVDASAQLGFLAELDETLVALAALPNVGNPARPGYVNTVLRPRRFGPSQDVDTYSLFTGARSIDVGKAPAAQQRALCWSALSIDQVLFHIGIGLQPAALKRLARFNVSWANYRAHGYTRQPLELALFRGRSSVHDTLPGRTQWLLGHLSLGAEVRWQDSLSSVNSTVVEAFGRLWYWNNYSQYSGVSAIVSVPSGRRPALGVMVHAARSIRGGMLVRREDKRWRPGVVVSSDLYGLLERSKRSVDQGLAIARGRALLDMGTEK